MRQQGLGRKVCRPDVGVQPERLAELEQALFGTNGTDTPFRAADGACGREPSVQKGEKGEGAMHTEQDGVRALTGFQRRLGQGLAMVIDPGAAEMMRRNVQGEVGLFRDELEHADGLGGYFGACTTGERCKGQGERGNAPIPSPGRTTILKL